MAKKPKLLYEDNTWTFDAIRRVDDAIAEIAFNELKLDIYPNQIEIIGSDQMLDAYSSIGLPIMYHHWSFGKNFLRDEYSYRKGMSGLAYEIVINSNPCISYCMEENSMTMQTLVIAHAAYGHNHFFKNNYLFKQWTDAESIVDYLIFARNYLNKCEEDHGPEAVEELLDACHSIADHGIDKYKRPAKLNKVKEREKQKDRADYVQAQANLLWSTLPKKLELLSAEGNIFPKEPQENILYFIEKHSPKLESWQREVIRIVRKINQYFYPQRQTKLMNEGWASFVHYYVMKRLWEKGLIDDGAHLEFIESHSGVLMQRTYDSKYYSGINPYALGFDMFTDIRRICENPTDEDKEYFPNIVNQPWLDVCLDAVANYRDESFVSQFLSPTVIRKWKMFEITNNQKDDHYLISAIQDKKHYNDIRKTLSDQYSISTWLPDIQITNANLQTDRRLVLKYKAANGEQLTNAKTDVLRNIERLWGYPVMMHEDIWPEAPPLFPNSNENYS
jgi:stage V sporulation protein R